MSKTYDHDLNIVAGKAFSFLRRHKIPLHWSRTKNERYSVHLMLVLYVLFCMADKSYRRFEKLVRSCPPRILSHAPLPSFTTMWRAWRRISPRLLRHIVQLSGRGGRDRTTALDPTHFQISRPSIAYCKRTQRKIEREPNRKVSLVSGTRSLRILDVVIYRNHRRNGLDDLPKLLKGWVKGKTIVADTEFDAEERFHQAVLAAGGKSVAPLRHKNIPIHRTKGSRRKNLRRRWPGRSYRRRGLSETVNSMLKRGMGETLRGSTLWQQARHLCMKCFTHNLLMRCG